jgi:hypothetical protein
MVTIDYCSCFSLLRLGRCPSNRLKVDYYPCVLVFEYVAVEQVELLAFKDKGDAETALLAPSWSRLIRLISQIADFALDGTNSA